jgi:molybdenum cofactor biosynthesis enzyme MoaA
MSRYDRKYCPKCKTYALFDKGNCLSCIYRAKEEKTRSNPEEDKQENSRGPKSILDRQY